MPHAFRPPPGREPKSAYAVVEPQTAAPPDPDEERRREYLRLLAQKESGGRHGAIGQPIASGSSHRVGDRALGKYQFMPKTLLGLVEQNPNELRQLYGLRRDPEAFSARFLADEDLQDRAAMLLTKQNEAILGTKDPAALALAHYSGPEAGRRYLRGQISGAPVTTTARAFPSERQYVADFLQPPSAGGAAPTADAGHPGSPIKRPIRLPAREVGAAKAERVRLGGGGRIPTGGISFGMSGPAMAPAAPTRPPAGPADDAKIYGPWEVPRRGRTLTPPPNTPAGIDGLARPEDVGTSRQYQTFVDALPDEWFSGTLGEPRPGDWEAMTQREKVAWVANRVRLSHLPPEAREGDWLFRKTAKWSGAGLTPEADVELRRMLAQTAWGDDPWATVKEGTRRRVTGDLYEAPALLKGLTRSTVAAEGRLKVVPRAIGAIGAKLSGGTPGPVLKDSGWAASELRSLGLAPDPTSLFEGSMPMVTEEYIESKTIEPAIAGAGYVLRATKLMAPIMRKIGGRWLRAIPASAPAGGTISKLTWVNPAEVASREAVEMGLFPSVEAALKAGVRGSTKEWADYSARRLAGHVSAAASLGATYGAINALAYPEDGDALQQSASYALMYGLTRTPVLFRIVYEPLSTLAPDSALARLGARQAGGFRPASGRPFTSDYESMVMEEWGKAPANVRTDVMRSVILQVAGALERGEIDKGDLEVLVRGGWMPENLAEVLADQASNPSPFPFPSGEIGLEDAIMLAEEGFEPGNVAAINEWAKLKSLLRGLDEARRGLIAKDLGYSPEQIAEMGGPERRGIYRVLAELDQQRHENESLGAAVKQIIDGTRPAATSSWEAVGRAVSEGEFPPEVSAYKAETPSGADIAVIVPRGTPELAAEIGRHLANGENPPGRLLGYESDSPVEAARKTPEGQEAIALAAKLKDGTVVRGPIAVAPKDFGAEVEKIRRSHPDADLVLQPLDAVLRDNLVRAARAAGDQDPENSVFDADGLVRLGRSVSPQMAGAFRQRIQKKLDLLAESGDLKDGDLLHGTSVGAMLGAGRQESIAVSGVLRAPWVAPWKTGEWSLAAKHPTRLDHTPLTLRIAPEALDAQSRAALDAHIESQPELKGQIQHDIPVEMLEVLDPYGDKFEPLVDWLDRNARNRDLALADPYLETYFEGDPDAQEALFDALALLSQWQPGARHGGPTLRGEGPGVLRPGGPSGADIGPGKADRGGGVPRRPGLGEQAAGEAQGPREAQVPGEARRTRTSGQGRVRRDLDAEGVSLGELQYLDLSPGTVTKRYPHLARSVDDVGAVVRGALLDRYEAGLAKYRSARKLIDLIREEHGIRLDDSVSKELRSRLIRTHGPGILSKADSGVSADELLQRAKDMRLIPESVSDAPENLVLYLLDVPTKMTRASLLEDAARLVEAELSDLDSSARFAELKKSPPAGSAVASGEDLILDRSEGDRVVAMFEGDPDFDTYTITSIERTGDRFSGADITLVDGTVRRISEDTEFLLRDEPPDGGGDSVAGGGPKTGDYQLKRVRGGYVVVDMARIVDGSPVQVSEVFGSKAAARTELALQRSQMELPGTEEVRGSESRTTEADAEKRRMEDEAADDFSLVMQEEPTEARQASLTSDVGSPFKRPTKAETLGSKLRERFTEERYSAALESLSDILSGTDWESGKLLVGGKPMPPEHRRKIVAALVDVGGYHFARGYTEFEAWSKVVIESIRKALGKLAAALDKDDLRLIYDVIRDSEEEVGGAETTEEARAEADVRDVKGGAARTSEGERRAASGPEGDQPGSGRDIRGEQESEARKAIELSPFEAAARISDSEVDDRGIRTIGRDHLPEVETYWSDDLSDEIEGLESNKEKIRPMPHQEANVNRAFDAFSKGRAFLISDGTGTGKTLSASMAAYRLIREDPTAPILIVVPNDTIARDAWGRELKRLGITLKRFSPGDNVRSPKVAHYITYNVLSNSGGTGVAWSALPKSGWELLIFDESQGLKHYYSESSRRSVNGVSLADDSANKRVLFLSATPFENILEAAYLKRLGMFSTKDELLEQYGVRFDPSIGQGGGFIGLSPSVTKRFNEDMLRFGAYSKSEVRKMTRSDGSEVRLRPIFRKTAISEEMNSEYHKALSIFSGLVDDFNSRIDRMHLGSLRRNVARALLEKSKIEAEIPTIIQSIRSGRSVGIFIERNSGSDYHADYERWVRENLSRRSEQKRPNTALQEAYRRLRDSGISFDSPIDVLRKALESAGIDSVEISGNVTGSGRTINIDLFQSGSSKAAIVTYQSGGAGLSLHDTIGSHPRTQIIITTPTKASTLVQVVGRMFRLGSESSVDLHYVYADTKLERKYASVAARRLREMSGLLTGEVEHPTAEELEAFEFGGSLEPEPGDSDFWGEESEARMRSAGKKADPATVAGLAVSEYTLGTRRGQLLTDARKDRRSVTFQLRGKLKAAGGTYVAREKGWFFGSGVDWRSRLGLSLKGDDISGRPTYSDGADAAQRAVGDRVAGSPSWEDLGDDLQGVLESHGISPFALGYEPGEMRVPIEYTKRLKERIGVGDSVTEAVSELVDAIRKASGEDHTLYDVADWSAEGLLREIKRKLLLRSPDAPAGSTRGDELPLPNKRYPWWHRENLPPGPQYGGDIPTAAGQRASARAYYRTSTGVEAVDTAIREGYASRSIGIEAILNSAKQWYDENLRYLASVMDDKSITAEDKAHVTLFFRRFNSEMMDSTGKAKEALDTLFSMVAVRDSLGRFDRKESMRRVGEVSQMLFFKNWLEMARKGKDVPFDLSEPELEEAIRRLNGRWDEEANSVGAPAEELPQRQLHRAIRDMLTFIGRFYEEIGVMRPGTASPVGNRPPVNADYISHQVLWHATREYAHIGRGSFGKPKPGFTKRRRGSTLPVNTDLTDVLLTYVHRYYRDKSVVRLGESIKQRFHRPDMLKNGRINRDVDGAENYDTYFWDPAFKIFQVRAISKRLLAPMIAAYREALLGEPTSEDEASDLAQLLLSNEWARQKRNAPKALATNFQRQEVWAIPRSLKRALGDLGSRAIVKRDLAFLTRQTAKLKRSLTYKAWGLFAPWFHARNARGDLIHEYRAHGTMNLRYLPDTHNFIWGPDGPVEFSTGLTSERASLAAMKVRRAVAAASMQETTLIRWAAAAYKIFSDAAKKHGESLSDAERARSNAEIGRHWREYVDSGLLMGRSRTEAAAYELGMRFGPYRTGPFSDLRHKLDQTFRQAEVMWEMREHTLRFNAYRAHRLRGLSQAAASQLVGEALIDYTQFSEFENTWLRGLFYPFWAWRKGNTERWIRAIGGLPTQRAMMPIYQKAIEAEYAATGKKIAPEDIRKRVATAMYARMATFAAMSAGLAAWNYYMFPAEEDKIQSDPRLRYLAEQDHAIVGYDPDSGDLIAMAMDMPYTDVLTDMGIPEITRAVRAWKNKEIGSKEAISEALWGVLTSVGGAAGPENWNPILTIPVELRANRQLWYRIPIYNESDPRPVQAASIGHYILKRFSRNLSTIESFSGRGGEYRALRNLLGVPVYGQNVYGALTPRERVESKAYGSVHRFSSPRDVDEFVAHVQRHLRIKLDDDQIRILGSRWDIVQEYLWRDYGRMHQEHVDYRSRLVDRGLSDDEIKARMQPREADRRAVLWNVLVEAGIVSGSKSRLPYEKRLE